MSFLHVAEHAAREAGNLIRGARTLEVHHKGRVDLVTQVDLECEQRIREILHAETPDIPVLAEEQGGAIGVDTRWLVDPLDGTTNFVHGFPFYAVSIALEIEGRLEASCIYDPVRQKCYTAERGGGAFCDGAPIRVSETPTLEQSLVLTGFAYDRRERADWYLGFVKRFLETAQGLRRAGAAAMDLVTLASGRGDGYWEFGLNSWDVAAGALLVQEAGGCVTDVELGPLNLDEPRVLAT
ncbi:MAG: inositol monophosphatase family protein, partial [Myxococcota bacterium]|nr:inositol monophosphatase family protein [Myxococcota bacterium]